MSANEPGNAQGNSVVIEDIKNLPLVDAHMHIQSNDIAPVPIMKGVLYYKGAKKAQDVIDWFMRNKKINYHELSFRNMDAFPVNDDISIAFGESLVGNAFVFFGGKDREAITNRSTGFSAELFVKEYGKVTRHTSFNIAGIYMNTLLTNSMGIASQRRIKSGTQIGDSSTYDDSETIQDSKNERKELIKTRIEKLGKFQKLVSGYYGGDKGTVEGVFEYSIVMGMELMYAHYWGAYGIPIYVYYTQGNESKLCYISNELGYTASNNDNVPDREVCHTAYDIEHDSLWKNYRIKKNKDDTLLQNEKIYENKNSTGFFYEKPAAIGPGNGYKHYLVPANIEEVVQYEDFRLHLEYTRMAAIKFPFKLLPFYHFDPRRFYGPEIEPSLHEFYEMGSYSQKDGNSLIQVDTYDIKKNVEEGFPFKCRMSIGDLKEELMETNDTGLFWGIKMYAALGFPPYLGIELNNEAKKVFKHLGERGYSGLLEFYNFCADNDIPVICHGSPQGMTIADSGVYLKEYLKQQGKSEYSKKQKVNFPVGRKQCIQGLGLIDDFSSPMSWRLVLGKMDEDNKAQKFKLCFAHYGGMGFLSGDFTDEHGSPYRWHKEINKLIRSYKQVYTDLSCYVLEKVPDLLQSITPSQYRAYKQGFPVIEEIYQYRTGSTARNSSRPSRYELKSNSQLTSDDKKAQVLALRLDMIEKNKGRSLYEKVWNIADKLAEDIKENEKLRYRIMFGTDWPMLETDVKGVPEYTCSMFILLQLVTKLLGNKWDAWHQFTVINPLRFLGLIEDTEDEGKKDSLNLLFEKLDRFKENLVKHFDEKIVKHKGFDLYEKKYGLNNDDDDDKKNIFRKYDDLHKRYFGKEIPTAHSDYMKRNGRLKLTNGA